MKTIVMIGVCLLVSVTIYGQTKKGNTTNQQLERGKILYEQHCLVCHQADGSGVQNLNPPLIKTPWVRGDKVTLIRIILDGMNEEIEVDGDLYHNVMPPFAYLSDGEIADILTFVRNSFSNKASTVTAKEVSAVRDTSK